MSAWFGRAVEWVFSNRSTSLTGEGRGTKRQRCVRKLCHCARARCAAQGQQGTL